MSESSVEREGFYVMLDSELRGPMSRHALVELLADHPESEEPPLWTTAHIDEWTSMRDVPGLTEEVAQRRAVRAPTAIATQPIAFARTSAAVGLQSQASNSGEVDIRGALRAMCALGKPVPRERRVLSAPSSTPSVEVPSPFATRTPTPTATPRRSRQLWVGIGVGMLVPMFGAMAAWVSDASAPAAAPAPTTVAVPVATVVAPPSETRGVAPSPLAVAEASIVPVLPPTEAPIVVEEHRTRAALVIAARPPSVSEELEGEVGGEGVVANSEGEAATSEDEGEAATSEGEAATSEGEAATSEGEAATSEGESETAHEPRERTIDDLIRAAVPEDDAPPPPAVEAPRPARDVPTEADVAHAIDSLRSTVAACTAAHATATLRLTFAGSTGRVTAVVVDGVFEGTPAGSCIARAVRSARVEPFDHPSFSLSYPLHL